MCQFCLVSQAGGLQHIAPMKTRTLTAAAFAAFTIVACGDDEDPNGNGNGTDTGSMGPGNIVEVATEAGNFGTLLQLATDAGLAGTLSTDTLTVFAPTDTAFSNLGVNTASVSADIITNILLNHVANGELDAAALGSAGSVNTLANVAHTFDADGVRGAAIASADVDASNGIIHVLSEVIVPPTTAELAGEAGLSELLAAVGTATTAVQEALDPDTLAGADPITVFAPDNAAFMAADLTGLDVNTVLSLHVVAGQVLAEDIMDGQTITTVAGQDLTATVTENGVTLTDPSGNTVNVVATDLRTLSGVVHTVDGVLIPN